MQDARREICIIPVSWVIRRSTLCKIAKRLGDGGGHQAAAGFRVDYSGELQRKYNRIEKARAKGNYELADKLRNQYRGILNKKIHETANQFMSQLRYQ